MRVGFGRCVGLGLVAALAMGAAPVARAQSDSLPEGVTPAMVTKGKQIFESSGLCAACHGLDAKGAIGPDLTDTVWVHRVATYDALVAQITTGIPESESVSGSIMPPRGGSGISDAAVKAVAAYVWLLSRRWAAGR